MVTRYFTIDNPQVNYLWYRDGNTISGKISGFKNDVLVLEINKYGILQKKEFYNQNDMEDIKISKATTQSGFKKNSFIYEFMSSMRQKIDDPLGERAKKRKEIMKR